MSHHKREIWIQHIEAWQESGLSRQEYLKANQLSASQFSYYYRNHFLDKASAQKPSKPVDLVPVRVIEEQPVKQAHDACMTLSTPNGYRIDLQSGFDADLLQQILRVVEAA